MAVIKPITGFSAPELDIYSRLSEVQLLHYYEPAPGIFMNHSDIENAATYVSGARSDGSIKCYYIYSHETYPFLYDSRVMFCIFLAASACVVFPAYSRKKEVGKSNEN